MRDTLNLLREQMIAEGIHWYWIPMDDYHQSEYVGEHFRALCYVSGFTGSAGTLLIGRTEARLFTDGRYFVQAAAQLEDSGIELMRMGEPGVPSLQAYMCANIAPGEVLGFDGRCVDAAQGLRLKALLEKQGVSLRADLDLTGRIWKDRPPLPASPVWILEEKWCGESAADKLAWLRRVMAEKEVDFHLISSLDDIAWILNLRGSDIPCNPVFLSYLLLGRESAYLFADRRSFAAPAVSDYLSRLGIKLMDYPLVYESLAQLSDKRILCELSKTNYALINAFGRRVGYVDEILPSSPRKAIKNEVEMENMRRAHIKDGVALTRFFYFMKHVWNEQGKLRPEAAARLEGGSLTELSAQALLAELRAENEGFLGLSFHTISAYGPNAAMCHYAATEESNAQIRPEGLYLVDSGGQYYEGTTDVTRTFAMGPLSDEMRLHFTLAAQAMLRLAAACFLQGCSGMSLDYIAREPFWSRGLNYNHGTGHGVGYLLNVHERPNGIRFKAVPERMDAAALAVGHVTSDEPGYYEEGSHGIRTENLLLCVKRTENQYGTFLGFEHLTLCPIDRDALDIALLDARDKALLNDYHALVFEKLSPYFEGEELSWLREVTAPLD